MELSHYYRHRGLNELERNEKDALAEIRELEMNQLKIPDITRIKAWVNEMLSIENLKEWLEGEDPKVIRSIFTGRIRVLCRQREYKHFESLPIVELIV